MIVMAAPRNDGLEPDLVADVRRHASLAVAAGRGQCRSREGGMQWSLQHAIAVSTGLGSRQGSVKGAQSRTWPLSCGVATDGSVW